MSGWNYPPGVTGNEWQIAGGPEIEGICENCRHFCADSAQDACDYHNKPVDGLDDACDDFEEPEP